MLQHLGSRSCLLWGGVSVVLTTPPMLKSCLRAFHWLAHTAFYALVLQHSSVREIESVRCCSAVLTVESITIYIQRYYLYYQMSSPRKLGNDTLQHSSVREIQSVRCCSAVLTVESITIEPLRIIVVQLQLHQS